jgi:hypothetical protein
LGALDIELARLLWGDPRRQQKYICAAGVFTPRVIEKRLSTEVANGNAVHMQYFLFFSWHQATCRLCGLRRRAKTALSWLSLRPCYWGMGLALKPVRVIDYAKATFPDVHYAGHIRKNKASSLVA